MDFTEKARAAQSIYIKQDGHVGPVSLHWLIREIPLYQALQYLEIGLKHRNWFKIRTKIGSHSSYVKHQYFERFHHINPCKTCMVSVVVR